MKTTRIREKIKKFLGDHPRSTVEILEHINSTMRHGTTSLQLGNVLSKDEDIVKVGYIKRSGLLSGGFEICEWATRDWVSKHCPEWVEGTPLILEQEKVGTSFVEIQTPTQREVNEGYESHFKNLMRTIGNTESFEGKRKINQVSQYYISLYGREPSRPTGELFSQPITNPAEMIEQQRDRQLSTLQDSGVLPNPVEFSFLDFRKKGRDFFHGLKGNPLFPMAESCTEHGWDVFPLSEHHFRQLLSHVLGSRNLVAEELFELFTDSNATEKNLQAFVDSFNQFPLRLNHNVVWNLSDFFTRCRLLRLAQDVSQVEVDGSPALVTLDLDLLFPSTLVNRYLDSINSVHFILVNQFALKPTAEMSALLFLTSLERFNLSQDHHHFLDLLSAFQAFTNSREGTSFLDEVPPNTLHPCFDMEDPVLGTHMFMNMAVLEKARQNPNVLDDRRLGTFRKDGSMLLDRDVFESRIPSQNTTATDIKKTKGKTSRFRELRSHYLEMIEASRRLFSVDTESSSLRRKWDRGEELVNGARHTGYDAYPNFLDVDPHQFYFRRYVHHSFQPRGKRTERNKQTEREILAAYGDMAAPNPLRAFDSGDDLQLPLNALEAIERVSHNSKNQGLRTQNRLVAMLDMIWGNFHRRESFGNRFVGLDLLEEIDALSSMMPESRVAELLLFHQHRVLRLYDKPGKDDLSRTNKLSRNNFYARMLHQFQLFLEDPSQEIDHLARPSAKSPMRRLLHPIRLHTGVDLSVEELPYDVVLAIALSRMETLVDVFEQTFAMYMRRQSELPSSIQNHAPSNVTGDLFRYLANFLCLEICQMHMMVQHLGRGVNWKKSHMHYHQTKLAVEGNSFEAIRDDFSAPLDFQVGSYEDGLESMATVLEGQGIPMPKDLVLRLNHYCLPVWGSKDNLHGDVKQDALKLLASINLFIDDDQPTGMDYVILVRELDRLYVNNAPGFLSPDFFAFNSFEYF